MHSQHEYFVSGKLVVHLQGAIYPQVMDVQPNFSITVTLSGSGNTARTGKSLMTTMWQYAMLGCKPERILKLTEAALYELLSEGTTIFRKSHNLIFIKLF